MDFATENFFFSSVYLQPSSYYESVQGKDIWTHKILINNNDFLKMCYCSPEKNIYFSTYVDNIVTFQMPRVYMHNKYQGLFILTLDKYVWLVHIVII